VVMRRKGVGGPTGANGQGGLEPTRGKAWGEAPGGLERRTPGSSQPGTGPRFQRRSDDKIREEIWELLNNNADLDASEVEVHVEGGEVTLSGTVESRDARWLTEDLVTSVSGVREVYNQIKVAR
jgi:osmotically-inducible protein OsmY